MNPATVAGTAPGRTHRPGSDSGPGAPDPVPAAVPPTPDRRQSRPPWFHSPLPMSLRLPSLVLSALTALLAAGQAVAFGPDGHRIVAGLAQRQLQPGTLAEVNRLLGAAADQGLAGIANWADEIRGEEAWRHTSRWHFVNFPRGECSYRTGRDCEDGRCIVAALAEQARRLGNRRLPDHQRLEALRFVVHLVGDIHQPLHAGWGDDRGGNLFQIYIGRGSNLHALWDSGILASAHLDWQAQVERLAARRPPTGLSLAWSPRAPAHWAEESCALIGSAGIYPPRPGQLPAGYVGRQYPRLEQQLVLAGARLAALLDAALGGNEAFSARRRR